MGSLVSPASVPAPTQAMALGAARQPPPRRPRRRLPSAWTAQLAGSVRKSRRQGPPHYPCPRPPQYHPPRRTMSMTMIMAMMCWNPRRTQLSVRPAMPDTTQRLGAPQCANPAARVPLLLPALLLPYSSPTLLSPPLLVFPSMPPCSSPLERAHLLFHTRAHRHVTSHHHHYHAQAATAPPRPAAAIRAWRGGSAPGGPPRRNAMGHVNRVSE